MKNTTLAAIAATFMGLGLGASAQAASFTGDVVDITVRHGIETDYSPGLSGCQIYENLGVAIGGGVEVGAVNDIGGGCSGGIQVDIDGDAQTITLDDAEGGAADYRWVLIEISGFDQTITAVDLLENGVFSVAGFGGVIPDPMISFTMDMISILFDPAGGSVFATTPVTGSSTIFSFNGGANEVPLPAAAWFMMTGIAGFAASKKRKAKKA